MNSNLFVKLTITGFVILSMIFSSCKDDDTVTPPPPVTEFVITDDGSGTGTVTWESGNTYILDGFVFVNDGQTLTIEAGAVVKGRAGQGANASALIVARGGKINAAGTASEPIIFTAEQDDLSDPSDIAPNTTGLWGGVLILGAAPLNSNPGETQIEGIPSSEPRGLYGGTNASDNSGTFQYCSIRYGGTDIGAGNEINGLTLGGVGNGTTIDHVEVIFNADDGVEFFGGTVNTKYLAVAFNGDDAYDYDEGFKGKGQFWFVVQSDDASSDRGGEHDGGTDPETAMPYATPVVYNATYIGRGEAAGKRALTFRDNAGGEYHNSIFVEWGKGVDIEILGNGDDSYLQYQNKNLKLENNVFWNVAGNDDTKIFAISAAKYGCTTAADPAQCAADSTAEVDAAKADFLAYFASANNTVTDPGISVGYNPDGNLDPVPATAINATPAADAWYTAASYKGAFATGDNWLKGWSFLDDAGYLK